MSWRKWLVRGLVFSISAVLVGAGLAYQHWTNPAAVREQVVQRLERQFPGADAHLEAARLRLLGGIALTDLRLVRKDDPLRHDFAYVPAGVVYHDKEQMLDGTLSFRKVELLRPRLRIIREKDGRWNLVGLLRPLPLTNLLPTLVVQEGTILFEDRASSGLSPVEIHNVQMTLINDPLTVVSFEGKGKSDILGRAQLRGYWQRDTGKIHCSLQLTGINLTTALLERLACWCPHQHLRGVELSGQVDLQVDLDFSPGQPLAYRATARLQRGHFRHPQLPLPLDELEVTAHCQDGLLTMEALTATSGKARIHASGMAQIPCLDQHLTGKVIVQHLPMSGELCSRLPSGVRKLFELFDPSGPVTVHLEGVKQHGDWTKQHCRLLPEDIRLCFKLFPYPVERIIGEVDIDMLEKLARVDLRLAPGPRELSLRGVWKGAGVEAAVDLDLEGKNLPLDEKVFAALPPSLQKLGRSFNATGQGDIKARFRHVPGMEKFSNEYHVTFRDGTVCWDRFPYPLEKVSGQLDILPDYWLFHNFRGEHNGGVVHVKGRSFPHGSASGLTTDARITVDITGQDISIDADLRRALQNMQGLARAWDTFSPGGRLSFRAAIERLPNRPEDLDIAVNVRGCTLCPSFFPYPLHEVSGSFRYHRNRLELHGIQARHGLTRLGITRGVVDLGPTGGFYADIEQLYGNPVILTDEPLLGALPRPLRRALLALQLREPVALQTRVIVARGDEPGAQPDLWWDGRLWLNNARVKLGVELEKVTGVLGCRGRHNGRHMLGFNGNLVLEQAELFRQPFRNVHSRLHVPEDKPDVLQVSLHAPLFGGDISGVGRVDFHSDLRYELNLTASQINLKQLGEHNLAGRAEWEGAASARLHLVGQADINSLDGHGSIDIPSGKLYNLPWLLDLLKFLGLRWPDRTAFEEAHASFTLQGQRLHFDRLEFWGNAVSMCGKGEVNLDGSEAQFDFYPTWARMEQLLPPALRTMSPAVSKNLLQIEVRGKLSKDPNDLKFHKKPVPLLLDPLRQLRDHLVLPAVTPGSPQVGQLRQPMME